MDFRTTTVVDLAREVSAGRTSAVSLAEGALARIDELDAKVNAFVVVDAEGALRDAAAIDARVAAGEDVGPLAGVPLGVKDLEDAIGLPTSKGSAVFADGPPAERDSALVERLRAAGCVVIGKTNTPEMGYKADTTNPRFGSTRNPWDLSRTAGGSSGGSAAALAAGLVPLCTGSDGGGSIRIPSSVCGLTGLKPSLGRVPAGGTEPPSWADLSTGGPMARRARDIAYALDAVVGPDATDLRSLPLPDASWTRSLEDLHAPRRVGWSPDLGYGRTDAEVRRVCEAALEVLVARGTEVVEIGSVFPEDPAVPWVQMAMAGNLRRVEHLRGTEAWDLLDAGHVAMMENFAAKLSATDLLRADDECHRANLRLVELFHQVPLLLCPTVAGIPGPADGQGTIDGETSYAWVSYTYPFNMTRSPAGTVCAGFTSDGMPVGLQVVGPQHADVAVLRMLAVLEDGLAIEAVAPI
ncbi:MAG: amidase family protein [Actinomycetota bacterium]|nr:amidase family protein [Actinomycetota bacterium]